MKKLKKILSVVACFLMIGFSMISLTGCSQEEIKENTETTIKASSTIIPVELSKETAQGMYTTAFENLSNSQAYEINMKTIQGTKTINIREVGMLNSQGHRYVYNNFVSLSQEMVYGYYNDKFYNVDVKTKTYSEANYSGLVFGQASNVFSSIFNSIVSGRYFNGYYYITSISPDDEYSNFVEVLIKDDFIVEAHLITTENNTNGIGQTVKYLFNYENVDTSVVVTSLNGYTEVTP